MARADVIPHSSSVLQLWRLLRVARSSQVVEKKWIQQKVTGIGGMAQSIKCKCEDLSSNFQNQHKPESCGICL